MASLKQPRTIDKPGRNGTPKGVSGISPTNGRRRSRDDIRRLKNQIIEVVAAQRPMTVRQVFYRLVSRSDSLIAKTEREYKGTVARLLVKLRRAGEIPYEWISDNTRWMRKPTTHRSASAALERFAQAYRRDLWAEQPVYVEVWIEKDAIAGVLMDVTREWDVPLMVSRGFSSESFLYHAAEKIKAERKPAHLYYFGDHDPSGRAIDPAIERGLRRLAPDADITFERVAVTESQIRTLHLPTRPTKKSDSRAKSFRGRSVEVDAIEPDTLREICRDCITRHLDRAVYERVLEEERLERETLRDYARAFDENAF
jgi:hypothetical protein